MRTRTLLVVIAVAIAAIVLFAQSPKSAPPKGAYAAPQRPLMLEALQNNSELQPRLRLLWEHPVIIRGPSSLVVVNPVNARVVSIDPAAFIFGNQCYTMHTFTFARESANSDATKFLRSSTCTPANKFRVKKAVATPKPK